MVDRISTTTRYAQLVADMKMNQYNFNKLTAQLSSGNKVTVLSDFVKLFSVNYRDFPFSKFSSEVREPHSAFMIPSAPTGAELVFT